MLSISLTVKTAINPMDIYDVSLLYKRPVVNSTAPISTHTKSHNIITFFSFIKVRKGLTVYRITFPHILQKEEKRSTVGFKVILLYTNILNLLLHFVKLH